jgi:hypothetical protein
LHAATSLAISKVPKGQPENQVSNGIFRSSS